jgi:hypothetical protein
MRKKCCLELLSSDVGDGTEVKCQLIASPDKASSWLDKQPLFSPDQCRARKHRGEAAGRSTVQGLGGISVTSSSIWGMLWAETSTTTSLMTYGVCGILTVLRYRYPPLSNPGNAISALWYNVITYFKLSSAFAVFGPPLTT